MDKSRISDEMLSAHVDGQLSAEDSEAVLRLALSDAEVAPVLDLRQRHGRCGSLVSAP